MKSLGYKPNLDETLERLKSLYNREATDSVFASFAIPSPTVDYFKETVGEGFCTYPDPLERASFWDACLRERADIEDDSVPSAYLSEFDQGLYGGLVGGKVQFMSHDNGWISSMAPPILGGWKGFDDLAVIEDGEWMRRFRHQLRVFVESAGNRFGVSHFILIDGLNFVFELLGATRTYESLIDHPDMVRRAVSFAFDLNVRVQEEFFDTTPALEEGTFSNMAQWLPGRIVSESVDPFHMTSVDVFEEWGRENVERMFAAFDGGVLHLHGNGRHLLEAVVTLAGLMAVWLGDDTGYPRAFDVLPELRKRAGDTPFVVTVPHDDFKAAMEGGRLTGGVFYQVTGTPDIDTANSLMDAVRVYRCV